MGDVSNKTLVGLLVVAILVSLVGTFVSLDKLGSLGGVAGAVASSGSGTASLNVTGSVSIQVDTNATFGSLVVNDSTAWSVDNCTAISLTNSSNLGGQDFTASPDPIHNYSFVGCLNTSGAQKVAGAGEGYSIVVENNGQTRIDNLTLNSSQGASGFDTNVVGTGDTTVGDYQFRLVSEAANTCDNFGTTYSNTTKTSVVTTDPTICTNFTATDSADALAVEVTFVIPDDSELHSFSDTLTFTATTT